MVKRTVISLFGKLNIEVLKRPSSYIIKLQYEPGDKIKRIILLPPHGFTANSLNVMNSHPEARKARVTVKGVIRSGKAGFSLVKDIVNFAYYVKRDIETIPEAPYTKVDHKSAFYKEKQLSSKDSIIVVRENGLGFYHNIINLSNEWVLLILEKELSGRKKFDLLRILQHLKPLELPIFKPYLSKVIEVGDGIFKKTPKLVSKVVNAKSGRILESLILSLNIPDTGNHEACTIYATILKIGKKDNTVIEHLRVSLANKIAPSYYLKELIKKLSL